MANLTELDKKRIVNLRTSDRHEKQEIQINVIHYSDDGNVRDGVQYTTRVDGTRWRYRSFQLS